MLQALNDDPRYAQYQGNSAFVGRSNDTYEQSQKR